MATTGSTAAQPLAQRLTRQGLPVVVILTAVLVLWVGLAVWLNAPGAIERVLAPDGAWTWQDLLAATMEMQRRPAPVPDFLGAS